MLFLFLLGLFGAGLRSGLAYKLYFVADCLATGASTLSSYIYLVLLLLLRPRFLFLMNLVFFFALGYSFWSSWLK